MINDTLKYALVIPGIFIFSKALSQDNQDTIFFNDDWEKVETRSASSYYRLIDQETESKWVVKDYYAENDSLEMRKEVSSLKPMVNEGTASWYYKNGQLKREGVYLDGDRVGTFTSYYETGERKSEYYYSEEEDGTFQIWDENGEPFLTEGTGITKEPEDEEGDVRFIEYKDYKAVEYGYYMDGNEEDIILDTNAEFPGGNKEFGRFLGSRVNYPKEAMEMGIEGKVYVSFIVKSTGEVDDLKVVRGIFTDCDAEAMRVIRSSPNWTPGTKKGNPVDQKTIIPIVFKLE